MNKIKRFFLKTLRKIYLRKWHVSGLPQFTDGWDEEAPADILGDLLDSRRPCMIARFGSTELLALCSWYEHTRKHRPDLDFIRGISPLPGDWPDSSVSRLCRASGFYPESEELCARFCELMLQDIPMLDVLGSWLQYERLFDHLHHARRIPLLQLEPYNNRGKPWSSRLEGRKVLVIHPFSDAIERQYRNKRELLFSDKNVLPPFELQTIKAVQSLGGLHPPELPTWFDALEYMKSEMDKRDYEICLIGCGAYGFPLAAHAKRCGKQAVHMGGALQLLFGIKGKRWTEQYGTDPATNHYLRMFNEHWIFPDEKDKPVVAQSVEDACYW